MEKRLPYKVIDGNMGSQYHHYFLGIVLNNDDNWKLIFNNYMSMLVKHFYNGHGDFSFDGIYSCAENILRRMIIRGPVSNFNALVMKAIDNGDYVVLNLNEQVLSHRRAYQQYYFRHDLLIYGYDSDKKNYITAGFDENMNFCEQSYSFAEVENAYHAMQNEWDFEIFLLRFNTEYQTEINLKKIISDLQSYINGENCNKTYLDDFFQGESDTYYVNNSYTQYYGIQLYDYLIDRLNGQKRIFLRTRCNDRIGSNDLRTVNALFAHLSIIEKLVGVIVENERKDKLIKELKYLQQFLSGAKMIELRFIELEARKDCKKAIKLFREAQKKEVILLSEVIEVLESIILNEY